MYMKASRTPLRQSWRQRQATTPSVSERVSPWTAIPWSSAPSPARFTCSPSRLAAGPTPTPTPIPAPARPFNQYVVLTASDTAANDFFGESVAISGNTIVVGAPSRDENGLNNVGGAYVYVKPDTGFSATTNAETAALQAPTSTRAIGDHFGFTVAIDGDNVVVGTYGGNDASGVLGAEKAYLFVKPVGGWTGALEPAHTLEGFGPRGRQHLRLVGGH